MPIVRKTSEFHIDSAHIQSVDAALICCIDPRWWKPGEDGRSAIDKFVTTRGWQTFVPLTEAGGIKVLASENPADAARRETLFSRIEQELGLHNPKILACAVHRDCGAYGYAKAFGSAEAESVRFWEDLEKAAQALQTRFGDHLPPLQFYIINADGSEEIVFDQAAAA
jgi:hypothetical protein